MAAGWLERVARKFGDLVAGAEKGGTAEPHDPSPSVPDSALARSAATEMALPVGATQQADQLHLPPGIRLEANGRFVAGGYSFSSLNQAIAHLARHVPVAEPTGRRTSAQSDAGPKDSATPTARAAVYSQNGVSGKQNDIGDMASKSVNGRIWVREPTRLTAGGHDFVTDMVPYGTPRRFEPRDDHSRIDPRLPVGRYGDPAGDTLPYWPSYSSIEPRARRTYLDWLSGGRSDASIPIGYVFLFFYGLEHRLLVEGARDEAGAMFAEVRRLLSIHGSNYSFQSYASRFLALATIFEDQDDSPPTGDCANTYDLELPLDVRLRLGKKLRDGKPFEADDALRWVLALPDVHLRTPGQRCFYELRELWWRHFAARYPDGLKVRTPKATVRQAYRAASGAFSVTLTIDELPDISGTSAPLGPLRAMLDGCIEELSPYSRLLGRDPEARGRLRGDLLLPATIRTGRESLETCRTALQALVGTDLCPTAADVARILDLELKADDEKLGAHLVRQIGGALDALGFGFEPDSRYGAVAALRGGSRLSLFEGEDGCPVEHDRVAYVRARGSVDVAILAAAADGEVVPKELESLKRRLSSIEDLTPGELARLMAHARAIAADPPRIRSALKKLGEVAVDRRAELASEAIESVLADGRVAPEEVRFLEALHTALGLPLTALYSALHRGAEDEGPVPIIAATPETLVPLPRAGPESAVAIDAARLEQIRNETSRVSALLAAIFTDEEMEVEPPSPAKAGSASAFDGLDGPHAALLSRLLEGSLTRAAFDACAAGLRLMPDGAIETINEWGFERFGGLVLEEDGDVCVSPDIIEELQPMGVAA